MKFSCHQQALSKALNIVSKAVTSRTTIPILKGILLRVDSLDKNRIEKVHMYLNHKEAM